MHAESRAFAADLAIAFGLALGTVAYLARLPRFLNSDEGYYLYESKRLLDGKVFYRDLFDLITPGAHYLMAASFAVFGTGMETARITDAAIHGLIVAVTYGACRLLGVRRWLAIAAGLAEPALFQPAWQCSSPHWLASLLGLLVLAALLRPGAAGSGGAVLPGILTGLLVAVQQQKGVVLAGGVAVLLLVEGALARRWDLIPRRLAGFVGGVLLVVVPLGALLLASAGIGPVWRALVIHPLVNYRNFTHTSWGDPGVFPTPTFPRLLAWVPVLTVAVALRAAGEWQGRRDPDRLQRSAVLAVVSAVSMASIAYYPDFIHIAFIGPIFAVVFADLTEAALVCVGAAGARVAATALLGALALQLWRVHARAVADFPLTWTSAFGRVNFHDAREPAFYQTLQALLRTSGTEEVFAYPYGGTVHLLTGAVNPTPYQLIWARYSRPDQLAEAIGILERRAVPWVVVLDQQPVAGDPVVEYVRRHYEQVEDHGAKLPLYRRIAP